MKNEANAFLVMLTQIEFEQLADFTKPIKDKFQDNNLTSDCDNLPKIMPKCRFIMSLRTEPRFEEKFSIYYFFVDLI